MNNQENQIVPDKTPLSLEMGEAIIEVRNLSSFTAVDNISFDYKGEIFGFLGANGAGKTTAMKMLIGISTPTSGEAGSWI
jgi:ABC-type multidrug transport system ATPase subunit